MRLHPRSTGGPNSEANMFDGREEVMLFVPRRALGCALWQALCICKHGGIQRELVKGGISSAGPAN